MSKTKTKFIITFVTIVFAMVLLNTGRANAVDITDDNLQTMLDLIPNEITLDITELEYEEAQDLVKKQIEEIWNDNDIETEGINIVTWGCVPYDIESFYHLDITISSNLGSKEKNISIIYSNTSEKNNADETYVKSLNIESPIYYETDLNEYYMENSYNIAYDCITEYYNQVINDDSITIKPFIGACVTEGITTIIGESGTHIGIFKNGNLYDVRTMGTELIIPTISVSNNLSESEISNYVINLIANYYSEYAEEIQDVTAGYIGEDNCYKLCSSIQGIYTINNPYCECVVIIKKVDTSINLTSEQTNVKLEADTTVIPSNTVLLVEPITEGSTYETIVEVLTNVNQFVAYDITLLSDGVEIQPNGNVKISIPIPEGFDTSKLVIYRIDEDGTKTKYDVTVSNGYAVFETNHFSTYVLAEEETTETSRNNETTDELDNTPKTGTIMNIAIYGATLLVITVAGAVLIKRKQI